MFRFDMKHAIMIIINELVNQIYRIFDRAEKWEQLNGTCVAFSQCQFHQTLTAARKHFVFNFGDHKQRRFMEPLFWVGLQTELQTLSAKLKIFEDTS